ncbi:MULTISPECIES: HAD-IA family hydrolase [unclassified Actinobaculum]|uniref:HAD-IA family hydrolase n=1 Tax=unclassified Actinobaculum TaxID=2609299 RepID=UPI000D527A35|nr:MULTISPECIES: HAD-IA family hydrolase [unclassified Actinobaculum]AWE41544.1 hypothetical protein DDD63_00755 [Actinobaculum sp. 313]RTE48023.1 HAD family hydrolase [Actinobaculum sp. 352]
MRVILFDLYGLFVVPSEPLETVSGPSGWEPELFWRHWMGPLRHVYNAGLVSDAEFGAMVEEAAGRELADLEAVVAADVALCHTYDNALIAFVQELHARGVRTGLLSNITAAEAVRQRELSPWFELFDPLCLSCDIHAAKPEPEAFHIALSGFGTEMDPADVLFLDDTVENLETAHRLGFATHHYLDVTGARNAIEQHLLGQRVCFETAR